MRPKNKLRKLLASIGAVTIAVSSAHAATYTWTQGGNPLVLSDPANWDGNGVIPNGDVNAALVISAAGAGNVGDTSGLAGSTTLGSITHNGASNFRMMNVGSWSSNSVPGIIFDTGSAANATIDAKTTFNSYYNSMLLNSNVEITSGRFVFNATTSYGVRGTGGFIINSGTELEINATHINGAFLYSGGVEVRSGGILDLNSFMANMGTGLLTIHDGGRVEGINNAFNNNVLFDINTPGTSLTTAFISGAGNLWNAAGTWTFDLAGAGNDVGNSWQIISGAATYDSSLFDIAGFNEVSSGVWTGSANSVIYEFDQGTGLLTVIPEPRAALLGSIGLLMLLRRRR